MAIHSGDGSLFPDFTATHPGGKSANHITSFWEHEKRSEFSSPAKTEGTRGAMEKILCGIDDHRILPIYAQGLSEEGHEIILAKDGDEASSKFIIEKSKRRSVKHLFLLQATWAALLLLLASPMALFAQMMAPLETAGGFRFGASAASSYQFKSDASGGGDFSVSRYFLMVGGSGPVDDKIGIGIGLTYGLEDYNFSDLKGFAVANPWNKIDRVGLGTRLTYKVGDDWGLHVAPMVEYAGERGADFDDSLMYGGLIGATYRATPDFAIGLGVGAFYRLEQTRVFPALIVSWKITDRLRLGNAYLVGPTGGAGLELTYVIDKNWQLSAGGGYRSLRFRLDSTGPIPSGIGENDSWPIFVRLSRRLWQTVHIDFYGGAAFGGKLRLEDSGGHEINSIRYNTAPLVGLTLRAFF